MRKFKPVIIATVVAIIALVVVLATCSSVKTEDKDVGTPDTAQKTTVENSSNPVLQGNNNSTSHTQQGNVQPNTLADFEVVNGASKMINFTPICQYPELPTGCEVTSLAMVLNYYNVQCDKCEIADNYLTKGEVGTVDFRKSFVGDPRDGNSYGCYANVIVETANKIIADKGANLMVKDYTGIDLSALYSYIDQDIPVIVWGTQDCKEGHYSVTWNVDGEDLTWFTPEHCMVLIGYDEESVWIADPMYGDVRSYDKVTFEACYNSLFKQAVVIK